MNLIKDRHGTYYAQRKVPERLQVAVARRQAKGKSKQVYLKKFLGTKDLKEANVRGKLVLAEFDRTLSAAAATVASVPVVLRPSLNATEIARMAEYVLHKTLAWDERFRVGGREELKRLEVEVRRQVGEGEELPWAFPYETLPPGGLSVAQLNDNRAQLADSLSMMREALALGDVSAVEDHVAEALDAFGIKLSPGSLSYPHLGIAVLRAYVRALQVLEQRNADTDARWDYRRAPIQKINDAARAMVRERAISR